MASSLKWRGSGDPVCEAEFAVDALWPALRLDDVVRRTSGLAGYEAICRVAEANSQKRSSRWWKRGPKLSVKEVQDAMTEGTRAEDVVYCGLLREVVGNPFSPTSVDPNWLTPTVIAIAHGIYGERTFDQMPILADALQDVGCDNETVLAHCRSEGPHVRGCWVLDLLTGRE